MKHCEKCTPAPTRRRVESSYHNAIFSEKRAVSFVRCACWALTPMAAFLEEWSVLALKTREAGDIHGGAHLSIDDRFQGNFRSLLVLFGRWVFLPQLFAKRGEGGLDVTIITKLSTTYSVSHRSSFVCLDAIAIAVVLGFPIHAPSRHQCFGVRNASRRMTRLCASFFPFVFLSFSHKYIWRRYL